MQLTFGWLGKLGVILLMFALVTGCTRDRIANETNEGDATDIVVAEEGAADEPQVTVIAPDQVPTATPEPEPTPEPTPDTMAYTVQPGDTISGIAEKFGISSEQLLSMNLLPDDELQPGQVLRVPNQPGVTPEGLPTPTPEPVEYVIQEGDTLLSIALQFGVSANEIVAANTLDDPNALTEGQTLIIPNPQIVPESSQNAAAAADAQPFVHTVEAGETLFAIAEEYDVASQSILEANGLSDPNALFAGQELIIPGVAERRAAEEAARQLRHTVTAGETLFSIAQQYGVTMDAIMAANDIANADTIQVGQELVIPGVTTNASEAVETEAVETGAVEVETTQAVHTVAAGETLFGIAQRYGVEPNAISAANNIADPDNLQVGEDLVIPGVSPAQAERARQLVHEVKPGETLTAIAQLYGVDAAAIIEANEIDNPDLLAVGEELIIPQE